MFKRLIVGVMLLGFVGCSGNTNMNVAQVSKQEHTFKASVFYEGKQVVAANSSFSASPIHPDAKPESLIGESRRMVKIKTDGNGEANIQIEPGRWYIGGLIKLGSDTCAIWSDEPIDIYPDTKIIDFKGLNAKVGKC